VIRQNRRTGERSLDLLHWGLIPYWCTDLRGGRLRASGRTIAQIHDRMPAILKPTGYDRWLGLGLEPDAHDLLVPFLSELLTCGQFRNGQTPPITTTSNFSTRFRCPPLLRLSE
jgi:putative SOS response-associated peptidase YedK